MGISPPASSGNDPFSAFAASVPSASASVPPGPGFAPVFLGFSSASPPSASFSAPPPGSDPFSDSEDHLPDEDPPFVDPFVAPLPSDAFQAEFHCMVKYILGLFPQSTGSPAAASLPHALFENFFASASPPALHLSFSWFDRVRTALIDAASRLATFIVAGRLDRAFLLSRNTSYVGRGERASGRAVPVNESLLAHFDRQLRPSLLLGLIVKYAIALEPSFRAHLEALSHAMWVLPGLLGFVRLQRFTPADPSLFNQLVNSLSKGLAHQASVSASHTAFICHKRREFYLSHLPAYFSDVTKHSMLESPVVFADTLFFVRKMLLGFWTPPVPPLPCGPSSP